MVHGWLFQEGLTKFQLEMMGGFGELIHQKKYGHVGQSINNGTIFLEACSKMSMSAQMEEYGQSMQKIEFLLVRVLKEHGNKLMDH